MNWLLLTLAWGAAIGFVVAFMHWRASRERARRQAVLANLERRYGRPRRPLSAATVRAAGQQMNRQRPRRDDDDDSVMALGFDSAPLWGDPPSAPDCTPTDTTSCDTSSAGTD